MTSSRAAESGTPWYRHFWPWFIVILLTLSVVGSLFTVTLAFRYQDVDVRTLPPNVLNESGGVDGRSLSDVGDDA